MSKRLPRFLRWDKEYILVHLPVILMTVIDLLLGAAWWGENHFMKTLDREVMKNLVQKANLTASVIRERLLSGDTRSAISFCRKFDNRIFRITLISPQGQVLADTTPSHLAFDNHSGRSEFQAAKSGKAGFAHRYSETLGQQMIYYAILVETPQGSYVLRFAKEDFPYMAIFPWLTIGIVALIVITTVLLGWLQFYLLKRIYHPLTDIALCAGNISEGKSEIRIPIPDNGPVKPLATMLSKMTEQLKKQLAEMRKLESFRSDFLANVSHELKTPLTCIIGAVETIQEERDLPPAQYEMLLKMLTEQSARLNALIKDVLSLAALENDPERQRREFLPVDLKSVMETCVKSFQPEARQRGTALKITQAEAVFVPGDAQLLEQALGNLIHNALKYSESPDIELSLVLENDSALLAVTDHGCGIPEENRPRIFERFYRVHKERSRALGGTGLGLAIVKHTAQLHGGKRNCFRCPAAVAVFSSPYPPPSEISRNYFSTGIARAPSPILQMMISGKTFCCNLKASPTRCA